MLFNAQDGTLQKFQTALSDIWDVNSDDEAYKQSPDGRSLLFFQGMAWNLVNIADVSFELDGRAGGKNRSLIAIQEQWKSRQSPRAYQEGIRRRSEFKSAENLGDRGKPSYTEATRPRLVGNDIHSKEFEQHGCSSQTMRSESEAVLPVDFASC